MENQEDADSILPFLPLSRKSSSLFWPPSAVDSLRLVSRGCGCSSITSGRLLFHLICSIRHSLSYIPESLASSARDGYALFFDELMPRPQAKKWFEEIVPSLANLLLRMPTLLELHFCKSDKPIHGRTDGVKTTLRLLLQQEPSVVFLNKELISALLACSFFCLFPVNNRQAKHLSLINFDHLFGRLHSRYNEQQENKIKCIIHYFERICSHMPMGVVSFERKVLPCVEQFFSCSYPTVRVWSESLIALCPVEVHSSGFIEDQPRGALEVDFANKYFGGGALFKGCLQEEIRFMINPELIAGMLFLPCLDDNEAIEVIGSERFSRHTGYASSFRFSGDYVDNKDFDCLERRKTRIIALDAVCSPRIRQYKLNFLLRETNKAFCGFFDHSKINQYERLLEESGTRTCYSKNNENYATDASKNNFLDVKAPSKSVGREQNKTQAFITSIKRVGLSMDQEEEEEEEEIGIATGNWGCGAFGGDPVLKSVIQWMAASQALRPFILYYTLNISELQHLDQVVQWIMSHGWTVGDLWNLVVEYSSQRLNGLTQANFFSWLLPQFNV